MMVNHSLQTRQMVTRILAWLLSASTLALLGAGALVTSTGSSLSVPDWPLAYGQFFPPMVGGIFYEHGHRLIASSVGFVTLVMAIWLWFNESRAWVRWFGIIMLLLVIIQGVLGGITVLYLLPVPVSVSHAMLAQFFFLLTVIMVQVHSPGWDELLKARSFNPPGTDGAKSQTRWWALASLVLLLSTLLVGAIMRHTGAGLAIPDFPLVYGGLIPPVFGFLITVHFIHRVLAFTSMIVVLLTLWRTLRQHDNPRLTRPAGWMAVLVLGQVLLGGAVIWSLKSVPMTTLHLMNGALLIGATGLFALRCFIVESTSMPGWIATPGRTHRR